MKKLVLSVVLALASISCFAQSGYAGECNVLLQQFQAISMWKGNGVSKNLIAGNVIRAGSYGRFGNENMATDQDRSRWLALANRIYNGERFSNDYIATYLGRFCQPPYNNPVEFPNGIPK